MSPVLHDEDELPGGTTLVGGRYRVVTCVGTGGSARVYRVRTPGREGPAPNAQPDADPDAQPSDVALKVLLPARAKVSAEVHRLQLEHRFGQVLSDVPGVLPALEFGRVPELGDRPYLAFPFVRGEELDLMLTQGALPPARAAAVVGQVARVLQRVHARGVLHRDLKPSNIMVTSRGSLLLDFGVARWLGPGHAPVPPSGGRLTQVHELVGTQHYMSPEQVMGGAPAVSWDLYALGMTLFEALVGDCAFSDLSPRESLQRRCLPGAAPFSILDRRPGLAPDLAAFVDRALAPDPAQRFPTAAAFADALERITHHDVPAPPPKSSPHNDAPQAHTRPCTGGQAGPYTLVAPLGQGNRARVYRARTRSGEFVALKLLASRYRGRPERERLLDDEAEALRSIGPHPHIVALRDAGRLPGSDWPFLALDLVPGVSVAQHIRDDPAAPRQVAMVAMQVALALRACHRAGVVHRNVTPRTVLLHEGTGQAVLIDFSHCARTRAPKVPAGHPDRRTAHGEVPGTAQAMSPEQARAEPATAAMDVFAFGVLLFEMLTARAPFPDYANRDVFIALQARNQLDAPVLERGAVPGAPAPLTDLVNACVHLQPEQRPAMDTVVRILESVLATLSLPAPPMTALLQVTPDLSSEDIPAEAAPPAAAPPPRPLLPSPIHRLWPLAGLACAALLAVWALGSGSSPAVSTSHPVAFTSVTAVTSVPPPPTESPSEPVAPPPPEPPTPQPQASPVAEPRVRPSAAARAQPRTPRAPLPRKTTPPQPPDRSPAEPTPVTAGKLATVADSAPPAGRCQQTRLAAESAANEQRWSAVLRGTQKGKCWPDDRKRLKLRLTALRRVGNYAACVEVAERLADQRTATFCRTKLDSLP